MAIQDQKTSTIAKNSDEGLKPSSLKQKATVVYGSSWIEGVEFLPGQTIAEVLADTDLKAKAGYGNLKDGNVVYAIDGELVSSDTVISETPVQVGQERQIEILRQVGEKA